MTSPLDQTFIEQEGVQQGVQQSALMCYPSAIAGQQDIRYPSVKNGIQRLMGYIRVIFYIQL